MSRRVVNERITVQKRMKGEGKGRERRGERERRLRGIRRNARICRNASSKNNSLHQFEKTLVNSMHMIGYYNPYAILPLLLS